MPFVVSHGRKIYYERQGQGPALLFCHGAGSNAATWWQQLPVFAREFSCLTMDLRCFGRSVAPLEEFEFPLFVADALAVLDAEGVERAALIGQSLGGMVGVRLALQHAERLWAFVASDTSLTVDHPALLEAMARRVTTAQALTVEQRSLGRWFIEQHPARAALYAQINHFNPSAHAFDSEAWGAAMASLMAPRNLLPIEALAGIACPTLLVVGSLDPLVPVDVMQALALQVPGSELQVVEHAGHSAYFEKPEEFNENVLAFLKRHCPA
jgi:3-oxoadipate enol-lactonase